MKWKGVIILILIIASLLPAYALYVLLEKRMRPRESGKRFLLWMITVFALVFIYSFLVVLFIRLIFRDV
jgi:hypothetical protein